MATLTLTNTRLPQRVPVNLAPVLGATATSGYAYTFAASAVMLEFRIGGYLWRVTLLDSAGRPLCMPRPVVAGDLFASIRATIANALGRPYALTSTGSALAALPIAEQSTFSFDAL